MINSLSAGFTLKICVELDCDLSDILKIEPIEEQKNKGSLN